MINPTDEQKAILNTSGRVVRINARAGTGKTTTLQLIAEKNRDKKILYLVFNRSSMEKAQKEFPDNVRVYTVHSLAYRNEGYRWQIGHFTIADMLFAFNNEKDLKHLLASISYAFLSYFLNSSYDRLEDAVASFPDSGTELFKDHEQQIVSAAREISKKWYQRKIPCPHDFYLKLFHKSKKFDKELNGYDIILADEGQDLSPIMLDALKKCNKRIYIVGDTHQQIYGFRYALDAMHRLHCDEEFDLTLSFRFGKSIADLTLLFIQEAKNIQRFCLKGNPLRSSEVSFYRNNFQHYDDKATSAVLTRTNLSLFERAMEFRSRGKNFNFERDIYHILKRTLDVYWLSEGKKDSIGDDFISSFESIGDLETYADVTGDFQLSGMTEIVRRYADKDFPIIIKDMADLTDNKQRGNSKGGIVLSTVHTAKGQQYDNVFIDYDIADHIGKTSESGNEQFFEEINVAYVAFTRAIKQLYLPYSFQNMLTDKWRTSLKSYQKIARPVKIYDRFHRQTFKQKSESLQKDKQIPDPSFKKAAR